MTAIAVQAERHSFQKTFSKHQLINFHLINVQKAAIS